MPILIGGSLMWVDSNTSIVLNEKREALLLHLAHVLMLLKGDYELRTEGLWMPCGDLFGDDNIITYRLMEFGTRFLVLNYFDKEVVTPITPQLLDQLLVLIRTFEGGSNG